MINLILCGGSGTRLWPLSRTLLPKQFVRLFDSGHSLFQTTLIRNCALVKHSIIATGSDHYFLALDQVESLQQVDHPTFILEPVGRNTAPAIALACLSLDPEAIVLVTPSDHLITNIDAYEAAVKRAQVLAEEGFLVTFGITPRYAETGFGYIEADNENVIAFIEKPDLATAENYLQSGRHFWNSGMFCFKAGVFLEELQRYAPDVLSACEPVLAEIPSAINPVRLPLSGMEAVPNISVDYAVMERSDRVRVIGCDLGWSDLGSFAALYDELKKPNEDNAYLFKGENPITPICQNAKGNLVVTAERQVALLGVEDLVVVDTADALLISHRGSAQHIRQLVDQVRLCSPELTETHRLVHRPWGHYEVLLDTPQYKIKRIIVKTGCKISLQKHFHRNEHWVVVSGTATVTLGEETFMLRPNESTYIPMGERHRLENEGRIDLIMIEVQVGEYTGEDDIVREQDIYGR